MSNVIKKSENSIGEKWDKCLTDSIVKMGGGLALGIVFSVIAFRRKSWPIIFGLGAGAGMAYSNCQHMFDEPYLVKPDQIIVKPKQNIESLVYKDE